MDNLLENHNTLTTYIHIYKYIFTINRVEIVFFSYFVILFLFVCVSFHFL